MSRRARSIAVGVQWASQITNVAVMMAVVPLGGYWLDQKYGTSPWLVSIGGLLGFYLGFSHLMRLLKRMDEKRGSGESTSLATHEVTHASRITPK